MAPPTWEEKRFAAAKKVLQDYPNDPRLDRPIKDWFNPADRRLFLGDASRPVRQFLELPLDNLRAECGSDWMSVLVIVRSLERVAKEIRPVLRRSEVWARLISDAATQCPNPAPAAMAPPLENLSSDPCPCAPSNAIPAGSHSRDLSAELILAGAREWLCRHFDSPLLEKPLRTWLDSSDRHRYLGDEKQSLRNIIEESPTALCAAMANDALSIKILVRAITTACLEIEKNEQQGLVTMPATPKPTEGLLRAMATQGSASTYPPSLRGGKDATDSPRQGVPQMSQDETQSDQEAEEKLQINLRVSRRQREKWQRLADADDRPLAAWIRRQVEKQINADETGSGGTP